MQLKHLKRYIVRIVKKSDSCFEPIPIIKRFYTFKKAKDYYMSWSPNEIEYRVFEKRNFEDVFEEGYIIL